MRSPVKKYDRTAVHAAFIVVCTFRNQASRVPCGQTYHAFARICVLFLSEREYCALMYRTPHGNELTPWLFPPNVLPLCPEK